MYYFIITQGKIVLISNLSFVENTIYNIIIEIDVENRNKVIVKKQFLHNSSNQDITPPTSIYLS